MKGWIEVSVKEKRRERAKEGRKGGGRDKGREEKCGGKVHWGNKGKGGNGG